MIDTNRDNKLEYALNKDQVIRASTAESVICGKLPLPEGGREAIIVWLFISNAKMSRQDVYALGYHALSLIGLYPHIVQYDAIDLFVAIRTSGSVRRLVQMNVLPSQLVPLLIYPGNGMTQIEEIVKAFDHESS